MDGHPAETAPQAGEGSASSPASHSTEQLTAGTVDEAEQAPPPLNDSAAAGAGDGRGHQQPSIAGRGLRDGSSSSMGSEGRQQRSPALQLLVAAAATAALAGLSWLWRKQRGQQQGGAASTKDRKGKGQRGAHVAEEPIQAPHVEVPPPPDTFQVVVAECSLQPPGPPHGLAPQPLEGATFVVSEDMDVQGLQTTFGVPAWSAGAAAAGVSAPGVCRAVAAGATCVGKVAVQPAVGGGLSLGDNFGNPFNKARVSGGGSTGAGWREGGGIHR